MTNVINVDFVNKTFSEYTENSELLNNNPWDHYLENSASSLTPIEFAELIVAISSPKYYEKANAKIQNFVDGYFDIVHSTES